MMRVDRTSVFGLGAFVVVLCHIAAAQYPANATIEPSGSQLIVRSDDPRPMEQALIALTQRYGWSVDYQDPMYFGSESEDISAPQWRKDNPKDKGFLAPAGRLFTATLSGADDLGGREEAALKSLVDQYNKTSNPGTFHVVKSSRERWAIVGNSRTKQGNDPMGVMVHTDAKTEAGLEVLPKLIDSCAAASGVGMTIGTVPLNILAQALIQGQDKVVSCRVQLEDILSSLDRKWVYHLLYDIGSATYAWNIMGAPTPVKTE